MQTSEEANDLLAMRARIEQLESVLAFPQDHTRLALAAAGVGTVEWCIDDDEQHWDARTYEIYGIPGGERISQARMESVVHPDDLAPLRNVLFHSPPLDGQARLLVRYRILGPGGALRHLEMRGQAYYSASAGQTRPVRILGTVTDVTDSRSAEESLRQSEANFRSCAEAIPGFLFICRSDGTNTYVNGRCEEYTGLPAEELCGAGWLDVIHPSDRQRTIEQWDRSVRDCFPYEAEYRLRGHDGVYRWFLTRALPMQQAGCEGSWLGVCVDIDAQKQAETELKETELRFRTMAEAVPSLLFANLPGGDREYTSPRWVAFTGMSPEECWGQGWRSAIHPDDLASVDEAWAGTLSDPQPLDLSYRVRRNDGAWRWVVSRAIRFENLQTRVSRWFGSATDVHDLRQAEHDLAQLNEALQHKVREFETLLQVTPIGIGMAEDPECRVIRLNPAMAKMFGVEAEINSWRTPDWNHLSFRAFHKGRELQWREFPMHVAVRGTPVREFELDVLHPNGVVRNLSGYADPLRDAQGKITGCVAAYVDTTEMRKMRASLERSNEELQRFAYAASHDLQSPLRTVRTFAQMLERHLEGKLDAQAAELLSTILEGSDRMTHLVRDLLTFAQAGHRDEPPVVVDVSVVLHEAMESLRLPILESDATIRHDSLPSVRAHPAHLLQLFQNLLSNSIKYRRAGVPPFIFVSGEHQDGYCLFAVRDNGQGFDPAHAELIFEPFKRLHGKEISGTGIGLATCYRIIQRYKCRIWADSQGPGQGATVRFTMPLPETQTEDSGPMPQDGTALARES